MVRAMAEVPGSRGVVAVLRGDGDGYVFNVINDPNLGVTLIDGQVARFGTLENSAISGCCDTAEEDHMDRAETKAESLLRSIEDRLPLRPSIDRGVIETDDLWAYTYNSVRFLDEGDSLAMIPTGPIVVPKDGAEPWVAPSAYPALEVIEIMGPHGDRPLIPPESAARRTPGARTGVSRRAK